MARWYYAIAVRIFDFENGDAELSLLPMAARRALDWAGCKLSLSGWQGLSLNQRLELATLGSAPSVDVDAVKQCLRAAEPAAVVIEPVADPPAERPPQNVVDAYGRERPIPPGTWAALEPLGRYALAKVAFKARPERLAAAYAEIIGASALSSHLAPNGGVRMVGVGNKATTERHAEAEARVSLSAEAFAALRAGTVAKGDVLGVARVAGILAAKRTPELIPLCHGIALTRVSVDFELSTTETSVLVRASADAVDRTGVEMEAMTAVSIAALTIYDMLKGIDRAIEIGPIRLNRKSGGRTGDFQR